MNNNPDQLDLFDSANYKLTGVLPTEISDQWQKEFYSIKVDAPVKTKEKKTETQKTIHNRVARTMPKFITNKALSPYIGSLLHASIVDIRKNYCTHTVEMVLSVETPSGPVYAVDHIGFSNIPIEYTIDKMRQYLELYPTKGGRETRNKRDTRCVASLVAFYAGIRARFLRTVNVSPVSVLVEPCMSVRGNVYLKVHQS